MKNFKKICILVICSIGLVSMAQSSLFAMKQEEDKRGFFARLYNWLTNTPSYKIKYVSCYAKVEKMFKDLGEPLSVKDFLNQYTSQDQQNSIFYSLVLMTEQPIDIQKVFDIGSFLAQVEVVTEYVRCDKNQIFDFCYKVPLFTRFLFATISNERDDVCKVLDFIEYICLQYSFSDLIKKPNSHDWITVLPKLNRILSFILNFSVLDDSIEDLGKIIVLPINGEVLHEILQYSDAECYFLILNEFIVNFSVDLQSQILSGNAESVRCKLDVMFDVIEYLFQNKEGYEYLREKFCEFLNKFKSVRVFLCDFLVGNVEDINKNDRLDFIRWIFEEFLKASDASNNAVINTLERETYLLINHFDAYNFLDELRFDFSLIPDVLSAKDFINICNEVWRNSLNLSNELFVQKLTEVLNFLKTLPSPVQKVICKKSFADCEYSMDKIYDFLHIFNEKKDQAGRRKLFNLLYNSTSENLDFWNYFASIVSSDDKLENLYYILDVVVGRFDQSTAFNILDILCGLNDELLVSLIFEKFGKQEPSNLIQIFNKISNFAKDSFKVLMDTLETVELGSGNGIINLDTLVDNLISYISQFVPQNKVEEPKNKLNPLKNNLTKNESAGIKVSAQQLGINKYFAKIGTFIPRNITQPEIIKNIPFYAVSVAMQNGNTCGHHALYNSLKALEFFQNNIQNINIINDGNLCQSSLNSFFKADKKITEKLTEWMVSTANSRVSSNDIQGVCDLDENEISALSKQVWVLNSENQVVDISSKSEQGLRESHAYLCDKNNHIYQSGNTIIIPVVFHTGGFHWVSALFVVDKYAKTMFGLYFDSFADSITKKNIQIRLGLIIDEIEKLINEGI